MAKLLYLAVTSRLLERPVSVAVKGPSSGGKCYLTEHILRYFPESSYHALTAMSERTPGLLRRTPEAPFPRDLRGRGDG